MKVTQSWLILCEPKDYKVRGILQARMLEWTAFSFSRGSSQPPRDQTQVFCLAGRLPAEPQGSPELKGEIDKFTIVVGNLNTPVSTTDTTTR